MATYTHERRRVVNDDTYGYVADDVLFAILRDGAETGAVVYCYGSDPTAVAEAEKNADVLVATLNRGGRAAGDWADAELEAECGRRGWVVVREVELVSPDAAAARRTAARRMFDGVWDQSSDPCLRRTLDEFVRRLAACRLATRDAAVVWLATGRGGKLSPLARLVTGGAVDAHEVLCEIIAFCANEPGSES